MALSASQKTLLIRSVSAITAVLIIGALYYFFAENGLRLLIAFAVIMMTLELNRMFFKTKENSLYRGALPFHSFIVFLAMGFLPGYSGLAIAIVTSSIICLVLFQSRKNPQELSVLLSCIGKIVIGAIYVGLLPGIAFRLLALPQGTAWFLCLLTVVFAGDTLAYLTGSLWGKTKLLPEISPNKSVEGALGGLMGSAIASTAFGLLYFGHYPLWKMILLGVVSGMAAQYGDLFESLIKRVADQKDSGNIMPGHGGVLDRIDGVLFAAPFVYFFAEWLGN